MLRTLCIVPEQPRKTERTACIIHIVFPQNFETALHILHLKAQWRLQVLTPLHFIF